MSQFADAVLVSPGEEEIKISADAGIKSPGVNACADRSSKKGRSFSFQAESDTGNVEYKRCLLSDDFERIDSLTTQLAFRLHEGGSQALYRIGIEDDGSLSHLSCNDLEQSLVTLDLMCESISAVIKSIEKVSYFKEGEEEEEEEKKEKKETDKEDKKSVYKEQYYHALVTIESNYDDSSSRTDVRVAVAGNVDAGKSTCIGVLKTGSLDDGRGRARGAVMVHAHEITSGRTSTTSSHVVGFKSDGSISNYDGVRANSLDVVTKNSVRLLSLIDLAGHEKYLRSMIYGVSSSLLDYCLVLVNARSGPTHMTHHHMCIAAMLRIPILLVFTKIDACPEHRFKQSIEETKEMLKSQDIRKKLSMVHPEKDREGALKTALGFLNTERQVVIPSIQCSFVEGTNIDFLRRVLRFLPKRRKHNQKKDLPLEFIIERLYNVPGVGPVVLGFVNQGTVNGNTPCIFGPIQVQRTDSSAFIKAQVKTIHYNTLPVKSVTAGNFACLALKLTKEQAKHVRRGQVLMETQPTAVRRFKARINIVYSMHTSIRIGYQPHLHILMVRQSAVVENCEPVGGGGAPAAAAVEGGEKAPATLRPGDMSMITFRFSYRPEFVRPGMRIMFRDGAVKGIGVITEILPMVEGDEIETSDQR
jgi:GTPase